MTIFIVACLTFILMECASWLIHKYLLHGALWFLHRSHHTPRHGWFEINDLVGIVYAVAAAICIMVGIETAQYALAGVGFGITAYGIFYFLLHDVIIHRRIKFKYEFKNNYIKRLIRAHKIHHKTQDKHGSQAFGFLYAAPKYKVKTTEQTG
jgi:beta-carotene 3-hydroxylase